jgi:Mrp family chromosome partitioning ATPase
MQQIHLIKKKNSAILGIIENMIVELKGEPSYTSGDQK